MEELRPYGLRVSPDGMARCKELLEERKLNVSDPRNLFKAAVDLSLKEIGNETLPKDLSSVSKIEGRIVLQVVRSENMAVPSINKTSKGQPRMLGITVSDGKTKCKVVEFEPTPALRTPLPPGTKLVLDSPQLCNNSDSRSYEDDNDDNDDDDVKGMVLLTPASFADSCGKVERLLNSWKLHQDAHKRLDPSQGLPPKFTPLTRGKGDSNQGRRNRHTNGDTDVKSVGGHKGTGKRERTEKKKERSEKKKMKNVGGKGHKQVMMNKAKEHVQVQGLLLPRKDKERHHRNQQNQEQKHQPQQQQQQQQQQHRVDLGAREIQQQQQQQSKESAPLSSSHRYQQHRHRLQQRQEGGGGDHHQNQHYSRPSSLPSPDTVTAADSRLLRAPSRVPCVSDWELITKICEEEAEEEEEEEEDCATADDESSSFPSGDRGRQKRNGKGVRKKTAKLNRRRESVLLPARIYNVQMFGPRSPTDSFSAMLTIADAKNVAMVVKASSMLFKKMLGCSDDVVESASQTPQGQKLLHANMQRWLNMRCLCQIELHHDPRLVTAIGLFAAATGTASSSSLPQNEKKKGSSRSKRDRRRPTQTKQLGHQQQQHQTRKSESDSSHYSKSGSNTRTSSTASDNGVDEDDVRSRRRRGRGKDMQYDNDTYRKNRLEDLKKKKEKKKKNVRAAKTSKKGPDQRDHGDGACGDASTSSTVSSGRGVGVRRRQHPASGGNMSNEILPDKIKGGRSMANNGNASSSSSRSNSSRRRGTKSSGATNIGGGSQHKNNRSNSGNNTKNVAGSSEENKSRRNRKSHQGGQDGRASGVAGENSVGSRSSRTKIKKNKSDKNGSRWKPKVPT
eukprot:jgi/Bigna1/66885/fgenesh1_pg.2_\